jgi:hypothetical protein
MQLPAEPSILATTVGSAAEGRGLRPRPDVDEPGWTFWELRTVNIHRVVGLVQASRELRGARELDDQVRAAVSRHFKRAWWRGLAYGVVVATGASPWTADDLTPLIDVRENRRGVLQWLIVVGDEDRRAVGIHTWEQVYLSQVYQATLAALESQGYRVARAVKDKDGLMKLLTGISALEGVDFPEYRDPS